VGKGIPRWIDEQHHTLVGEVYFLSRLSPERRAARWFLDLSPCRTNQSREPRLFGWCGTTNNVELYAHGLARVEAFAKNGRTRITLVTWDSPAGQQALLYLGYPDLEGETDERTNPHRARRRVL
jgi:hypothetical protein